MQSQIYIKILGVVSLILLGLPGCGIWPVMTEENGRRPHAMGKSDQVLWPWAPHPVHLNEEYGLAYRQALEGQILNPASAKNTMPVPGAADPRAIQYSMTRYQLMFENPPFSNTKLESGKKNSGKKSGSGGSKK